MLGLGAPIGSLLVGGRAFIDKARKYRKLFGGGWRQAGILAAAGLYALDHHWERMVDDHANAQYLAKGLQALGLQLVHPVETNMVFVDVAPIDGTALLKRLNESGKIIVMAGDNSSILRFVIHLQTPREGIQLLLKGIEDELASTKKQHIAHA